MVVSLALEMLRYRRVEGQEQPWGMELYPFLLMSRWVSLESFATSRLTVDKDYTAEEQRQAVFSLQTAGKFFFKPGTSFLSILESILKGHYTDFTRIY